jgi:hypothetical protein
VVSISCIACCASGVNFLHNEFNCESPFNSSNTGFKESEGILRKGQIQLMFPNNICNSFNVIASFMSNFSLGGLTILSTIACHKYLNGGQSCVLSGTILKPSLARHLSKSLRACCNSVKWGMSN